MHSRQNFVSRGAPGAFDDNGLLRIYLATPIVRSKEDLYGVLTMEMD
jgi:hypothetical protein